jgi:exopolysaccharide biosynthesis polyprenyl glycosylphosphotransferase
MSKRNFYIAGIVSTDLILIYLSFYLSYHIRFFWGPEWQIVPVPFYLPPWVFYEQALRVVTPLWLFVFALWGHLYRKHFLDPADEFMAIVKSVVLSTFLMIVATFLYRGYEYSRLVMGINFFISIGLIFSSRIVWKWLVLYVFHWIAPNEIVLIVGEGRSVQAVRKTLDKDLHRHVLYYTMDQISEARKQVMRNEFIQELILPSTILKENTIEPLLEEGEQKGIEIKILPDLLNMRLGEIMVDDSLGLPILHLKPLSLHGFPFYGKRIFDVFLSILIISIFFIPFLIIFLLIKLDSKGGIFFIQERVGFKEKRFRCVKFRTMHIQAEALLEKMQLESFRGGPAFKMKGDPRITRVGRILRKLSLDELPQIWNILKGEMSFIGPRPQVLKEASGNPDWAKKRFRILPGITGLWQVSGRADLSYEDMMRLDIYYLENWSAGLDLKILLKTFPVVLSRKGAY